MLYLINTTDVICYTVYGQPFMSGYELPEDGTNVPEYVGVMNAHNFKCVSDLCLKLGLCMNIGRSAWSG
jgi:hypothetical protein